MYYWCMEQQKGVKVRIERLILSEDGAVDPKYLLQSGKRFRRSQLFDSKDCTPTLPASGDTSALASGEALALASGGAPTLDASEPPLPPSAGAPGQAPGEPSTVPDRVRETQADAD